LRAGETAAIAVAMSSRTFIKNSERMWRLCDWPYSDWHGEVGDYLDAFPDHGAWSLANSKRESAARFAIARVFA
jgi:hypothetical protein